MTKPKILNATDLKRIRDLDQILNEIRKELAYRDVMGFASTQADFQSITTPALKQCQQHYQRLAEEIIESYEVTSTKGN